jgi:diaminohydroxyphosphoribosylaminopyrimidine deaminase/5-amino-6-(5-phosphoribosylamino)uracil reductase
MRDPNPLAADGAQRLRDAGIGFEVGLMEAQARELNIGWISRVLRGRPWVRMKIAASLDGRTALANGQSQWITGAEARADGHRWRARACAVATGIGTVRQDDPALTVRAVATPRQPTRVVIDSRLETPLSARVLQGGALVFCGSADAAKRAALQAAGNEVVAMPNAAGKVDLAAMLGELAQRGVNELHVEGGAKLNGSLLREGCVDEFLVYLAPSFLGDGAQAMLALPELDSLETRPRLELQRFDRVGEDLRILARLVQAKQGA